MIEHKNTNGKEGESLRIFHQKLPAQSAPQVSELMEAWPQRFADSLEAKRFLNLILFPVSRRWRYQLNGKTGNTFMLNALFEMEFGCRFTSRIDMAFSGNHHEAPALFQVWAAGLLGNIFDAQETYQDFLEFPGLSLATVRNPYTRAVSGFRYLCASHRVADMRFLKERIRLNALMGFDWERDIDSLHGFTLFLTWIEQQVAISGAGSLDAHWLPQHIHIQPDIYRPDMIGRTEEIDDFLGRISEKLERPILSERVSLARNASRSEVEPSSILNASTRACIEKIYAQDFDLFEYPR